MEIGKSKLESGNRRTHTNQMLARPPIFIEFPVSFFELQFSLFHFPISISLSARDSAALPIPGSAAAPSRANAPPAPQWFPGAVLRRAAISRHFSGALPPATAPHFPESPSADCSIRGAALLQNLPPLPRTVRERCPLPSA